MKKEPTYMHSGWSSGANCGSEALGVAKVLFVYVVWLCVYCAGQFLQQAIIVSGPEKLNGYIYSGSSAHLCYTPY